jgi:hypothetical protein
MSALSEEQIREYVDRCPEQNRWAFEGWLRGERHLDGDLIEPEGRAVTAGGVEWQVWFGECAISDFTRDTEQANRYAAAMERRFPSLRVTNEPLVLADR